MFDPERQPHRTDPLLTSAFILIFILAHFPFQQDLFGQARNGNALELSKSRIELGELKADDKRYEDIIIENPTADTVVLLRTSRHRRIRTRFSDRRIPPGAKSTLRIKYNPRKTGAFRKTIKVHSSASKRPVQAVITGEVLELPSDPTKACPDFGGRSPSDKKRSAFMERYGSRLDTQIHTPSRTRDQNRATEQERKKGYKPGNEEKGTTRDETAYEHLPTDRYKPNNVVFLVDVSLSMGKEHKLDLLKAGMKDLLGILRDIDRIGLVSYSTDPEVLVASVPADQKHRIGNAIEKIDAGGTTAGKAGIREAYRQARRNYINKGNNQVIIATDGAFNNDPEGVIRMVQRNADNGIGISVLGIRNEEWTESSMKKIARKGQGTYIHLRDSSEAGDRLVQEIKERSRK